MGNLLRALEPCLLVDARRPPSPERHPHVPGKALALLLEQEASEPLDEAIGDDQLAPVLGDEPPLLEFPLDTTLLGLADPGFGLRLGPPLRLGALLLEAASLGLRLAPLLLGLLLDPALPGAEGARDAVGELLTLRPGELRERVPELGRTDRPSVRGGGGERHAPSPRGSGTRDPATGE